MVWPTLGSRTAKEQEQEQCAELHGSPISSLCLKQIATVIVASGRIAVAVFRLRLKIIDPWHVWACLPVEDPDPRPPRFGLSSTVVHSCLFLM